MAIEAALVMLLLVPLLLGIAEFGRVLYIYDSLVKSTRSAARFLSKQEPGNIEFQQRAACIAVTGSPEGSGSVCARPPLAEGLTPAMVSFLEPGANPEVRQIATGPTTGTISVVTVRITGYQINSFLGTHIFNVLNLGAISVTVPFVFF